MKVVAAVGELEKEYAGRAQFNVISAEETAKSAADIEADTIAAVGSVAVSAGASAPDVLVREVVARLRELGCAEADEISITEESVRFTLPPELKRRLEAPTR